MIRSILIAGMHTEENQYQRYCDELWLESEHLPEVRNGVVPGKYDAALIASDIASHSLFHAVKAAYAGKPIFIARNGISAIRESLEEKIFGNADTLKKLRHAHRGHPRTNRNILPISARMWWILANFAKPGHKIKYADIVRYFEKNLLRGVETSISQAWMKGRSDGCLTDVSRGVCIFNGIRMHDYETFMEHNLECEVSVVMNFPIKPIIRREAATDIFKESELSRSDTVKIEHGIEASSSPVVIEKTQEGAGLELLLEEILAQQEELRRLKMAIEETIPTIIQREIQSITKVMSLNQRLAEIRPDEADRIHQVLDILYPKQRA